MIEKCLNKITTVKKHFTIIHPPPTVSLTHNTLTPLFVPLSEAILEVLFSECVQLCCCDYLDVLNPFKRFAFPGDCDFGEEPEVAVGDLVYKADHDTNACLEPASPLAGMWPQCSAYF